LKDQKRSMPLMRMPFFEDVFGRAFLMRG